MSRILFFSFSFCFPLLHNKHSFETNYILIIWMTFQLNVMRWFTELFYQMWHNISSYSSTEWRLFVVVEKLRTLSLSVFLFFLFFSLWSDARKVFSKVCVWQCLDITPPNTQKKSPGLVNAWVLKKKYVKALLKISETFFFRFSKCCPKISGKIHTYALSLKKNMNFCWGNGKIYIKNPGGT